MSEPEVLPEIKQIIGAMIFAASRPLTVSEMRKCLAEVAKEKGGVAAAFADVKARHVKDALDELIGMPHFFNGFIILVFRKRI